jgi:hypothetical protein
MEIVCLSRSAAMTHIEIKSRVGADGVLTISLPLGPSEANQEVKVTVDAMSPSSPHPQPDREQWQEFVERMAGCISDPTFERREQGPYEQRSEAFP